MLRLIAVFILSCSICLSSFVSLAEAADLSGMAKVKGVRVSKTADKVRIVVDADKEVDYETKVLSNPERIVVDLDGAWISKDVKRQIKIDSRFASEVRIAQHDPKTVRVVVETNVGKNNYDVFYLAGGSEPYRIVMDFGNLGNGSAGRTIDMSGGKPPAKPADTGDGTNSETESHSDSASERAEEVVFTPGLKGKKIVLDAGHGGSDSGAIGPTGVMEKNITLKVAQKTRELLQKEGALVLMTRSRDTEVSPKGSKASDIEELQARCDVANNKQADVFLSIHMDSFTSNEAHGTTGYYYSKGSVTSQRLAEDIHSGVVNAIKTADRGAKSCNFYVVKHTTMPAVLLEVAFVSNDKEEQLLNSEAGIEKAAKGIVAGFKKFFG